ncbi:MAG: elongation factor P maturation arginine rhamnosyltransferase EarP [Treponema sp.]|nr:elongation factor P maturation arginine rhamnosyltransferase EarP [Treponema sp.]
MDKNRLLILCKVVDNFGDIGVVYRLARSLSDLKNDLELTLVVSNLESFHAMASDIDPNKEVQTFKYKSSLWNVLKWDLSPESAGKIYPQADLIPQVILETFQCGRPDWLEDMLFSPGLTHTVQILNIDYLTAEEYAGEFHLLKSGTRSALVKKRFFMPGFTPKTGGLIINEEGASAAAAGLSELRCRSLPPALQAEGNYGSPIPSPYKIFFFAYEDDCQESVKAISGFQTSMKEKFPDFKVKVFIASGKSEAPFISAWEKIEKPFEIEKLPFLQQEEFDDFINKMDFLFVRGEDSLARAALSGLPYIWQAYRQDENYQLVKVNALIDRMQPCFTKKDFSLFKEAWQNYNDYENPRDGKKIKALLLSSCQEEGKKAFKDFSKKLYENGNLAANLLAYIDNNL